MDTVNDPETVAGADAPPRAGRKEWLGLAVIALPSMLYSMDLTVLNLALPQISAELKPSSAELLWIVDIYGFLVAGALITMGTLGDRIGRRKLLLIGATAFGIASALAAFANTPSLLIAARALLGLAGATLAPSTLSLIRNMFHDSKQRSVAIAVWITSYSVGAAIGPLLGGLVLEFFWWGSVFLLGIPVMVLLLITGPMLLPEYKDPDAGRLDLLSAALSLVAVLAVIYGLKQISESGFALLPVLIIVAGIALGVVFIRRQKKLTAPLMDLRLFRAPTFSASLILYLFVTFVSFGSFVFIAQYLQLVLGLSPLHAGLWTIPWALGFVVGSNLTPFFVRRSRPLYVIVAGLVVAILGCLMLTQVHVFSGVGYLVAGTVVFSIGVAPSFTLASDLIIGNAPPERAGAAAAISETSSELGGALGIALLGSVGTAIYRSRMMGAMPAGADPEMTEAAERTLGGAWAAAEQLGGNVGSRVLQQAQATFVQGFELSQGISAGLLVVTCITSWILLRKTEN